MSEEQPEIFTRVFRALHFPHRRREIVSAENSTPINVQPGEIIIDDNQQKIYAGLDAGTAVEIGSGGGSAGVDGAGLIAKMYLGGVRVNKAYLGETLILDQST